MNDTDKLQALATYFNLMSLNGGTQVFHTARQLGIFDAMSAGKCTATDIAGKTGLKANGLRLLLDCLGSLKVVEHQGDSYELTPVAKFLSGTYKNLGNEYWAHLPHFLKSGTPLAMMDHVAQSEDQYKHQVTALAWMMRAAAETAAAMLGPSRKGAHILDVGAGSAVWSLALAARDPSAKVTALDWPQVLDIAAQFAAQAGVADRFTKLPGNYRDMSMPAAAFDLALVGNVTHIETPEGNEALFRKIHGALKPGGEIAIFDIMPGQAEGDLSRTLYAMGLALRTEKGRVHTPDELQQYLSRAGFGQGQFTPLRAPPYTMAMMVAKKGE
jgi:ubiquinone/menaquinone biosynthesis C-methylase UbiE